MLISWWVLPLAYWPPSHQLVEPSTNDESADLSVCTGNGFNWTLPGFTTLIAGLVTEQVTEIITSRSLEIA